MSQTTWSKLPTLASNVSPAFTTHDDKQLFVVAVATNGDVRYASKDTSSTPWTAWKFVKPQSGPVAPKADPHTAPMIIKHGHSSYVFCRGADNNLYKTQKRGTNDWGTWLKLTTDGSVRGRLSGAFTEGSGGRHAHVLHAGHNNTVQYRRFGTNWAQDGAMEQFPGAIEGEIATDGSFEILVVIRTAAGQMLTKRKMRPWSGAWQSISDLPAICLDISNIVFYGGAFHVAYVMKTLRDDISGTYVYFLAHTRYRAGMYHDGYFRALREYQTQGNLHPKTWLAVYRNKLVAAYTDEQSYVRYAYWDTADSQTPWIGKEVVASGKSSDRPALTYLNGWDGLQPNDKKKANFGNDLFAAVRGLSGGSLWTINFSRTFYAQRIKKIGLAVEWCTKYTGSRTMNACPQESNLPDVSEIPVFSEVGFGTITLPDWLMSLIFKRTMKHEGDPNGYYYTWVHNERLTNAYFGPNLNVDYNMNYLVWHEEMGHRLASSMALWDDGAAQVNPNLMSDLLPDSLMKDASDLFGKWTNDQSDCKGGAVTNGRCRGFTGIANNYDVGSRQHSWIYVVYYFIHNSEWLREIAYDDLQHNVDLLKRKYDWVKKYIFRGITFKKANEPLPVVTFINKHSRKAIDVSGWSVLDNAAVQQYTTHCGDNQSWALLPDGEGYYQLMAMHSGKCLDVPASSQDNGVKLQVYAGHGGSNQKWELIPDGDDHYEIVAKHSGKCLDVASWGTADGVAIQQYARHGGDNQKWRLEFAASI